MTKAKSVKKPAKRTVRVAKTSQAAEAIGEIGKDTDTFILTFGQFSLIDIICAVLDQIGPADVSISTWTTGDADLTRTAEMLESAEIKSLKMIVDGSFLTRQPGYCQRMVELFGEKCIRSIKTHAKFVLLRSKTHDIVIRTSMNLNNNPRLENAEISEGLQFAEFFQSVVDEIFSEMKEGSFKQLLPKMEGIQESFQFPKVESGVIKRKDLHEPKTTHTVPR